MANPELTILAIHDNGGGGFCFERLKPYMPATVRLQAITLPGFDGIPVPFDLQFLFDYARYLQAMIAGEVRPLIILGTGVGASIGLEFAQHYADKIDGLILHGPVGIPPGSQIFPRWFSPKVLRTWSRWLVSFQFTRPFFKRFLFSTDISTYDLHRFFDAYTRCIVFERMFDLISPQWFASLQPVDLPVALLWRGQGQTRSADQLADYEALLPSHTLRQTPNWGHFPMFEHPQEYALEIVTLARRLVY